MLAGIYPHIANPDGLARTPRPKNALIILMVVRVISVFGNESDIDANDSKLSLLCLGFSFSSLLIEK